MINLKAILPEATWPLRHRILWPDQPFSYIQLPDDNNGYHYGLYLNGRLVSVISLFVRGAEGQFRKFATETDFQRQGLGSQLLSHLLDEAQKKGVKRIWCSARLDAAPFYQKFGLTLAGEPYLIKGIPYSVMEKYM